jgi:hypothetical protein
MPLALRTSSRAAFLFLAVLVLQLLATTGVVAEEINNNNNTTIISSTIISTNGTIINSTTTGNDDVVDDGTNQNDTYGWKGLLFVFFRSGLFFFIIFFPCFRGIRVWYSAGGRIRFRRTGGIDNEDGNGNVNRSRGWIIGLRYQAADLDRWLVLSGYGARVGGVAGDVNNPRKLTANEVYALPEITAPNPSETRIDGNGNGNGNGNDDIESGILGGNELAATYHGTSMSSFGMNDNINKSKNEISDSDDASSNASVAANDESLEPQPSTESPTAVTDTGTGTGTAPTKSLFTTTMSTSCSICIDDFEEGENIRLLPRCGHAFHTECILPWLTERQGCCPCCKALVVCPVIAGDGEEAKETDENDNDNENERMYPSSYAASNINSNDVVRTNPFVSSYHPSTR